MTTAQAIKVRTELAWLEVLVTSPLRPIRQQRIDDWFTAIEDRRYVMFGYPQGGEQWDRRVAQ